MKTFVNYTLGLLLLAGLTTACGSGGEQDEPADVTEAGEWLSERGTPAERADKKISLINEVHEIPEESREPLRQVIMEKETKLDSLRKIFWEGGRDSTARRQYWRSRRALNREYNPQFAELLDKDVRELHLYGRYGWRDRAGERAPRTPEQRALRRMRWMQEHFDLSSEQVATITPLMTKMQQDLQDLMSSYKEFDEDGDDDTTFDELLAAEEQEQEDAKQQLNRDEWRASREKIRNDFDAAVMKILTPEQQERYRDRDRYRKYRKGGKKHGHRGGRGDRDQNKN